MKPVWPGFCCVSVVFIPSAEHTLAFLECFLPPFAMHFLVKWIGIRFLEGSHFLPIYQIACRVAFSKDIFLILLAGDG